MNLWKIFLLAMLSFPIPLQAEWTLTLATVGDIMIGSDYPNDSRLPPNGGREMFDEAKEILSSADIAFGNLEGPILSGSESVKCRKDGKSCFAFRQSPVTANTLASAGFDIMSVANNHANDFVREGREETIRLLENQGIRSVGSNKESVAVLPVKGLKVAVLAFACNPFSPDIRDIGSAVAMVKTWKGRSDIVVVSFHGGAEGSGATHVSGSREIFFGEDRGNVRRFAQAVIDAGADLVFGHGSHVPRGLEIYRWKLVAYSLGNFATYGRFNLSGPQSLAPLLLVELSSSGDFVSGRIISFRQEGRGGPKPDPEGSAAALIAKLSEEDFGEAAVVVETDWKISPIQTKLAKR